MPLRRHSNQKIRDILVRILSASSPSAHARWLAAVTVQQRFHVTRVLDEPLELFGDYEG